MHAIIHRALAPQTLSHIWLVVTLALALALAVAQSAVAQASTAGAPSVAPIVLQLSTAPAATPLGDGPIAHHDAGACRTADDADEREAVGDPRPPGPWTCARPTPTDTAPALPSLTLFAPDPRTGADALAALYGGAGPHGPPAAAANQTILPVLAQRLPQRTTGSDLALLPPSAAATTPSALPGEIHRAADASGPAAPPFPAGPAPAITTVA